MFTTKRRLIFSLSVESSLPIDAIVSQTYYSILNDKRGWTTTVGKEFQVVNYYDADFHIFSNSDTVDRAGFPLQTNVYSCRNGNQIIYNYFRWLAGERFWT